jgi:type VI secretion system protein ImpL
MTFNGQELGGYVIEIRKRLDEISSALKIDFPVYVLFTKADLVSGFMEFFGSFDEARRRKVWGVTFQTSDRDRKMAGEAPTLFDDLVRRLSQEVADRMQEEPDAAARIAIFGFPPRFELLRQRVSDFLSGVFDPSEKRSAGNLRGFYFSSGTQEGTPIDQLLGAMGRTFGSVGSEHLSGKGRSFFLHDLLAKVIFAESGWVSYDPAGDRRALIGRYGVIAAAGAIAIFMLGALTASFVANRSLAVATEDTIAQYREAAGPALEQDVVSEPDLENVVGPLEMLRAMPAGHENRSQPVPPIETFGLGQRKRLNSASETAYRHALERMLRPRLLLQTEAAIHRNLSDPISLYEPLKIYLMLGGKAPKADDEFIVRWMNRDWEQHRFPGSSNREGRAVLERHLRAMLEYDDAYNPVYELDLALVDAARRVLGGMTVADRAQAVLKSTLGDVPIDDFVVTVRAGPESALVLEARDATDISQLRVPGIYTRSGFNDFYLDQLARVARALTEDRWVIGAGGEQGEIEQELLRLGPELLDRYSKEFAAAWDAALAKLKFRPMSTDKPQYLALSAAASPNSPIRRLFEAVALETVLTQRPETAGASAGLQKAAGNAMHADERARGLARIGIEIEGRKSQIRAGAAFADTGQVPGANIEAQFRPFHALVEGRPGQRPIDALVQNFHDLYQSMVLAASAPAQAERANASLQLKIQALRLNASRLPKVLANMVQELADELEGDAAETSIERLNETLHSAVTNVCREIIADRYPFTGGGASEVPISDFSRLFAPNGIIDRYFAQHLAPLVDMSRQSWEWRQESRLGRSLSKATLSQFQLAAEIRDAFFQLGDPTPSVKLTFTPFSLHSEVDMALLNIDGQVVQSYQTGSGTSTIDWPAGPGSGQASITLTPELPGRQSSMKFEGPWALKRLMDAGTVTRNSDAIEVRFVIGGRDVAYTIQTNTKTDPFSLQALTQFTCPTTL